jgi:hypothetical protein
MNKNSSIPPEGDGLASTSALIWTDHKSFVQAGMQTLFNTMEGADLEIRCKEKVFPLHKVSE